MRIIAGRLKGRTFDSPAGHRTHPMSEKIRGAIFNALGDIDGLTVFDAFAGSGAVAFEAISRGAKSALLTDSSKQAYEAMSHNIKNLDIVRQCKVVRANASGWSDNNTEARFDIIVADPPYDDVQEFLLSKLTKHLKTTGIYVTSLPPSATFAPEGMNLVLEKDYNDAVVRFYKC